MLFRSSNGQVTAVNITATGSNFMTFPSITFSGGGGSNAAAIALPFLSTPSFAPVNVLYDMNNTNTGGNVVVENCLVRRFPIYKAGDANVKATGGTRQICYRLKPGEAGWILRPDSVLTF